MAQRATERIEFRVRPEVAAQIRAAAEASHVTVSAFLTAAALARAEDLLAAGLVAGNLVWDVPSEEFDDMMASLDQPPVVNPHMVAAMRDALRTISHT